MHKTERYDTLLKEIRTKGLFKEERTMITPQRVDISTHTHANVLNFCANNYLGLADHPSVIQAAKNTLDTHGFGMASVRFICGTQDLHKELEKTIATFLGKEDAILYTSCFDANGGIFETLLNAEDAVFSDALNHASIIDGIRLCKAKRYRYPNGDIKALESMLADSKSAMRLIVTDGVFSMDGTYAPLDALVALAEKYDALLMVDDSHATGFVGETGRGTPEHFNVLDKVDIISSTLGKALGGGSGGFIASSRTIVELLRQRSRPYLFSNTLTPSLVGATLEVFRQLNAHAHLRHTLTDNTQYFRSKMVALGFDIVKGTHPIVPVMLYDATLAHRFAESLLEEGVYVVGFSYPVVPEGSARIRLQISAKHTKDQMHRALTAFENVGKKLGVLTS